MKNIIIAIFLVCFLILVNKSSVLSQSKGNERDKNAIVKAILKEFFPDTSEILTINLLKKNLPLDFSVNLINKTRKSQIYLVDKAIMGDRTYSFESIFIRRKSASITLIDELLDFSGNQKNEVGVKYLCSKRVVSWKCKIKTIITSER